MKQGTLPQRLAFAGRMVLLVGSLLGGCTAVVFAWWPKTVDTFEAWLRERHTAPFDEAWAEAVAARAAADSGRERALLVALSERVGPTAQLDRRRPMAVKVQNRLVELHREAGDSRSALVGLRRLRAIDPNSVLIARDLAVQLFSDPGTRAEAYTLLLGDPAVYGSGFAWRLPAQAELLSPLVDALASDGRLDEARKLVVTAASWPEPKWWSIYWWDKEYDPLKVAGCQPRVRADSVLQVDFFGRDAIRGLRILPPAFASCCLSDPKWWVREAGDAEFQPLPMRRGATQNLREVGSTLELLGNADPMVTFELQQPLPAGEREFRFTADFKDTAPEWLARLALTKCGPQLADGDGAAAKTLAELRRVGFASLVLEAFWETAPGGFSTGDKVRVPLAASLQRDGGASFAVDVPLPAEWTVLRLDLGTGEFATWRFDCMELRDEGGVVLSPAPLQDAALHDVEWKDHELIATGVDAQLQFVRPAGTERARVLHVEGLIR